MAKRILALVLALTMVFALAACKKSDKKNETTDAAETEIVTNENGETEIVEVEDDETEAETETNADGEVVTDAEAAETETNAAGDKEPSTKAPAGGDKTPAAKDPSTKAEIVALFNKAANSVKADKPGYKMVESNKVEKITSTSSLIEKIAGMALDAVDLSSTTYNVAKGASHNDYPVKGGSTNLSAAAVKSATCTKSGNNYNIVINMADERLETLPTNPNATKHGKAFNVLPKSVVDEQTAGLPGIKITKFQPTYSGCTIKCTITADGKMTKATYNFRTVASVEAKALGISLNARVPFAVIQDYTIKY